MRGKIAKATPARVAQSRNDKHLQHNDILPADSLESFSNNFQNTCIVVNFNTKDNIERVIPNHLLEKFEMVLTTRDSEWCYIFVKQMLNHIGYKPNAVKLYRIFEDLER